MFIEPCFESLTENRARWLVLVQPHPTLFIRGQPNFGSGWSSGFKNRPNRVWLTSKRVQIRVQPYNLTRPIFRSGWALKVQNRVVLRVGLALMVKIWI